MRRALAGCTALGRSIAPLLCLMLAGCAALGLQPAQSLDERLAYAYGTYTAVLQATASAQAAGSVSAVDVGHVRVIADQVRALLDGARAVETTNPAGASNQLQLATRILAELQTYLRSKGVT